MFNRFFSLKSKRTYRAFLCVHICVCVHARVYAYAHTCTCSCAGCLQVPGEAKGGLQIPRSWSCQQLYELSNLDFVNQMFVLWKSSMHSQSLRHLSSESHSYYCHWLIAPDQSKPVMDQGVWIQPLMFPFSFQTDMFQLRSSK